MRKLPAVALCLVLLASFSLQAAKRRAVSPPDEESLTAAEWLNRHKVPFSTTEAGSGLADLQVVGNFVGSARVVSLGEASHTAHQFFTMKHRLVEYLVLEKGFTVLSIEGTLPDVDAINDYVVTGKGDPAALLPSIGWIWNTNEVLALVEWIRAYNATRGARPAVSFRGFDAQLTRYAAEALSAYLQRVDPANAAALMQLYNCYRPYEVDFGPYALVPRPAQEQCRANVTQLHDTIAARRDAYTSASTAEEFTRLLRYARTIVQAEEMNSLRRNPDGRDEFMAENVAWIANVEHPGEKVMVWAHNAHVSAELDEFMGSFLRRLYFPGEQMVIFGFGFDHGSFSAYGVPSGGKKVFNVASPHGGHEEFFHAAATPLMFVDLRHATSRAARTLLDETPRRLWDVGVLFDPDHPDDYRPNEVLSKNYDVMVWVDGITPTTLR
jgi:erythromycin esterase